jgi:hypothetical protein
MQKLLLFGVAALIAAHPVPAKAGDQSPGPDTRAAVLEAAREEKAKESAPPQRSAIERGLQWYDSQSVSETLFANWNGFHLAGGSFPAGAGWKFGIGFDKGLNVSDPDPRLPNRIDVSARAAYSTRGYARLSGAIGFRNIGGRPIEIAVHSQYYEFPQEDFFGIGPDTLDENRTNYLIDSVETGATVGWRPAPRVLVGVGASYLTPSVGHGTDSRFPSVEEVFDPATIPGFTAQPDFIRADASIAYDWRDNPPHPHGGGRYAVAFSDFHDRDLDAYDFRRVALEAQQYVPLFSRYRILAFRGAAVVTDASAGQQVPFYFQPTLGGAQNLRGFREFRFRDNNALLLTAEYRWEAWWALDGALFVDAGTVASNWRDLSFREMDVSYGIGFRLHSNRAVSARLDLAFSSEGFIPLLRFEHVF